MDLQRPDKTACITAGADDETSRTRLAFPAPDLQHFDQKFTLGSVALRPKCLEVLLYLTKHAGRVVSKEELMTAVWPIATVSDESLTQCISEIRRALRDDNRQILRTIPKRGYIIDDHRGGVTTATPEGPDVLETPRSAATPDEDGKVQAADPSSRHQDQAPRQRWTSRGLSLAASLTTLLAVGAVAAISASLNLFAKSFDGAWYGGLTCDKLPFTSAPLITHIEVNVSRGSASYSRPVLSWLGGGGIEGVEQGTGTIDRWGTINLTGNFAGKPAYRVYAFTASYSGAIAGRSAELRGTQVFDADGEKVNRSCFIKLSR